MMRPPLVGTKQQLVALLGVCTVVSYGERLSPQLLTLKLSSCIHYPGHHVAATFGRINAATGCNGLIKGGRRVVSYGERLSAQLHSLMPKPSG